MKYLVLNLVIMTGLYFILKLWFPNILNKIKAGYAFVFSKLIKGLKIIKNWNQQKLLNIKKEYNEGNKLIAVTCGFLYLIFILIQCLLGICLIISYLACKVAGICILI